MKSRNINVRVDDKLAALLDELREECHINVSNLIRHILTEALSDSNNSGAGEALRTVSEANGREAKAADGVLPC